MQKFERIVTVTPAYDKRSDDPKKNYGIGSCRIFFVLKGELGAVQFMIGTDWYPVKVQKEFKDKGPSDFELKYFSPKPDGWDVGYHSPKPMYDGQHKMEKCDHLEGGCYYDGSGLRAQEWVKDFVMGGTNWLWPKLEEEYKYRFVDKEEPVSVGD